MQVTKNGTEKVQNIFNDKSCARRIMRAFVKPIYSLTIYSLH